MAAQEQPVKSRVIKIDSEETWNFFITQARNQGCLVIAHFTAAWCIPSVAMKPVFENLAFSFHDTMFLVVDVDDVKEVASKMKIKAMPSFVLMREGAQVDKLVGANPNEIWKRIDRFVNAFSSQGL